MKADAAFAGISADKIFDDFQSLDWDMRKIKSQCFERDYMADGFGPLRKLYEQYRTRAEETGLEWVKSLFPIVSVEELQEKYLSLKRWMMHWMVDHKGIQMPNNSASVHPLYAFNILLFLG